MANFKTHLTVAAGASFLATGGILYKELITPFDMPWFIFLGTIGGLLPDIDSNNSRPLRLLFNSLAVLASLLVFLHFQQQYPIQHIFVLSVGAFFMVRYPLLSLFKKVTVHRGVFHSILCACFFTLLTVYISARVFQNPLEFSWLSGLFIGFGFIVHLLLDEIYSVDLSNARLKKSFGTAFKLFSLRYIYASLLMFLCCVGLFHLSPANPYINFNKHLHSTQTFFQSLSTDITQQVQETIPELR